jgi:dihydroflavonol-4-reductase
MGRRAPKIRLPRGAVLPLAYVAETFARLRRSSREPLLTVDGLKMSKTLMFFSSDKARKALGYAPRPAREAIADAVDWVRTHRMSS